MSDRLPPLYKSRKDSRAQVGMVVSIAWVGTLALYFLLNLEMFASMKPNEIGDFLAGSFGPLAFFWLVLGYLQQGEELEQNTRALMLQAQEIKNSVEEQRALVAATQAQLVQQDTHYREELRRASLEQQPAFQIVLSASGTRGAGSVWRLSLLNIGPRCTDFQFVIDPEIGFSDGSFSAIATNEEKTVVLSFNTNVLTAVEVVASGFELVIKYRDSGSNRQVVRFKPVLNSKRPDWSVVRLFQSSSATPDD